MGSNMYLSNLPDETPLSLVSFAGSHDSAAAFVSFSKWAQCQNKSIKNQLKAGARLFDIRLVQSHGVIRLVHSTADCFEDESKNKFLTFETVLGWCSDFLKNNPRETIIMSVKKDRGLKGPFDKIFFNSFYNKFVEKNDIWFTENRIPLLSEVRGKIVLMRRCKSSVKENRGLDFSVWKNQKTANDKEPFKVALNDKFTADVQDSYSVPPHEKWEICKSFFEACAIDENNAAVNFLSTSGAGGPCKTAEIVNAGFDEYEFKDDKPRGWALFDFFDEKHCEKIMGNKQN